MPFFCLAGWTEGGTRVPGVIVFIMLFLMLLFPGPWKAKLWFIPLGLVVIHFVNVFRIFGLGLTLIPWPAYFDQFHDYFFKTIFYFIIFLMWVVWVEFIAHRKSV